MTHRDFNEEHGYDPADVAEHVKKWNKTQLYNDAVKKIIDENAEDMIKNRKQAREWKSKRTDSDKIRRYNLARNRMVAGLTQFFDGVGDLLDLDHTSVINSDFMNLVGIMAFSKSTAFDKVRHWAKAEKEFQESKGVDLPGSTCRKARGEKIQRPEENEDVWYSIQFLYRQLEVFRYVPNYDVVSGVWNLVAGQDREVVEVLDHWYYIHNSQIDTEQDLSQIYKGYFFRYNAKLTSRAQCETLFVLNSLFNHSGSKPLGTLERAPWYLDAVISGNSDGNLPHSTNVTTHKIDKRQQRAVGKAPIVGRSIDGVRSMPSENEDPEDFEDRDIAKRVVEKKYGSKKELEKDVKKKEKSRKGEKGYFKGKDGVIDQHWDQDDDKSYDQGFELPDGANVESESEELYEKVLKRDQGSVFYDSDDVVRKIIDGDGNSVSKLTTDRDRRYKVGRSL